jgi:hypothetical protein
MSKINNEVVAPDIDRVIKIIDEIIKASSIYGTEERMKVKRILLESDLAKTGKLSMEDEKTVVEEIRNWRSYPPCEGDEVWNIWDKFKEKMKESRS